MEKIFVDKMTEGCDSLGISLTEDQAEKFYLYYVLLNEWNRVMNLTAITELEDVVYKHFIDSLSLIRVEKDLMNKKLSLVDVGTGAGFPGIPLKIIFPGLSVTLLDSLNKRVGFLRTVIEKLDLSEITAIHGRAEDFGQDEKYREKFDICVSRAVANISTLAEYCIPLVRIGGKFVAYKSGKSEEELERGRESIRILGAEVETVNQFLLPGANAERNLIVIKKVKSTQKKYPRKAGIPGKQPIE